MTELRAVTTAVSPRGRTSALSRAGDRPRAVGADDGRAARGPRRPAACRERAESGATPSSSPSSSTRCSSAPGEDLDRYPRTLDADLALCAQEGVDLVFAPVGRRGLPAAASRRSRVDARPARRACSRAPSGPGHFAACSPWCQAVRPGPPRRRRLRGEGRPAARAGAADGRRPGPAGRRSSACATVREPDGLALSSRNRYLSAAERARQRRCRGALRAGAARRRGGGRRPDVLAAARAVLDRRAGAGGRLLALVDPTAGCGRPPSRAAGRGCWWRPRVGATRLIDNTAVRRAAGSPRDRYACRAGSLAADAGLDHRRRRRRRRLRHRRAHRRAARRAPPGCACCSSPRPSSTTGSTRWAQGGIAAALGAGRHPGAAPARHPRRGRRAVRRGGRARRSSPRARTRSAG